MFKLPLPSLVIAATICLPAASTLASPVKSSAVNLIDALQETRSMTKVGFNSADYLAQARKVQVALDTFLRSAGARDYSGGAYLKRAAEMYIGAADFFPGVRPNFVGGREIVPQLWQRAALSLEQAEKCINGVEKSDACETIAQAQKRMGK